MSAVTRHVTADVAGKLGLGLAAVHIGIERAFEGARIRREEAVDSVTELAIRLREARRDQRAAEARAIAAEARALAAERALARAGAEAAALREALSVEREFSAGLREILGA